MFHSLVHSSRHLLDNELCQWGTTRHPSRCPDIHPPASFHRYRRLRTSKDAKQVPQHIRTHAPFRGLAMQRHFLDFDRTCCQSNGQSRTVCCRYTHPSPILLASEYKYHPQCFTMVTTPQTRGYTGATFGPRTAASSQSQHWWVLHCPNLGQSAKRMAFFRMLHRRKTKKREHELSCHFSRWRLDFQDNR